MNNPSADTRTNPYRLELPAVVAFSGGRTSGYMLRHILDAFGGKQPDDLQVCFQNTGLEHEATYKFVKDCAKHWGVRITWLEYAVDADNHHSFTVVDSPNSSRDGEPFTRLLRKQPFLPNSFRRICTQDLKVKTQQRFLKTLPAFDDGYTIAVGLRHDEPRRVHRMRSDNGTISKVCPLFDAKVTEQDVRQWWNGQPFDLKLPNPQAGNCVGCFLKGTKKLEALMVDDSTRPYFDWWANAEISMSKRLGKPCSFNDKRPTYAQMLEAVRRQGMLPLAYGDDESLPCMCHD